METSFYKYGWEEMDRPLPLAAARLEPAEDTSGEKAENHIRRCPLCGTLYCYSSRYDYYVNGSEDEEELVRLTPDEARRFFEERINK